MAQKPNAILYGDSSGDGLQLYWSLRDWPADRAGFNLKRMEESGGAPKWIRLNRAVLTPSSGSSKDYANQGLTKKQATELRRVYADLDSRGGVNALDEARMLALLKENNGLKSGDRVAMSSSYDLALIYGFAAVDNSADAGKRYKYALHEVSDSGVEDVEPLAMFDYTPSVKSIDTGGMELTAKAEPGVTLTWKIKEELAREIGVRGFGIYRKENKDAAEWTALVERPYGTADIREGVMFYKYPDNDASVVREYVYAIAPVNMFQRELARYVVVYKPSSDQVSVRLEALEISDVKQEGPGAIGVTWAVASEAAGSYASVSVLRVDSVSGDYRDVSPALAPQNQKFVDSSGLVTGKKYYYKLRAVTKAGAQFFSRPVGATLVRQPDPVEGLQARVVLENEKPLARISWNAAKDGVTDAYVVESDRRFDKMLREGSIGKVRGTHVDIPLLGKAGGGTIRFSIIPVSKYDHEGAGRTVALAIPLLKMPDIAELTVSVRYNQDGALIRWDYPDVTDLAGFELYMNDVKILGTDALRPQVRGWVVSDYAPRAGKVDTAFTLVAVGAFASSDKSTVYFRPEKGRDYSFPAIRGFRVRKEKSADGEIQNKVRLSWSKPGDDSLNRLSGFRVYSDYKQKQGEFRLFSATTYPATIEEVILDMPEAGQGKYRFRLAPVTKSGDVGQYSEASVHIDRKDGENE